MLKCACVCINIKCVVYKHERGQKVKRYYPDEMIAKEDKERKGKKVHKKSRCPRKNKRSTKTHFLPKEREKREKSETKKLPKNSSSFFCSSLQKRVIIFLEASLVLAHIITYLKRVFIPSSTTTTTIIPLYYRNDDSDDVRRESKQY